MNTAHQVDTASHLDWRAAFWAGLIAGLVFLVAEMGLVGLMGESPWGPPRMMAAIVMGEGVLPPPATFDMSIVMVAMVIHLVLSVILAFIFMPMASRLNMSGALFAGAVFGLVVYGVNFYGFTALFPWFEMARNAVTIISHIIFGLVLAWSYKAIQRP